MEFLEEIRQNRIDRLNSIYSSFIDTGGNNKDDVISVQKVFMDSDKVKEGLNKESKALGNKIDQLSFVLDNLIKKIQIHPALPVEGVTGYSLYSYGQILNEDMSFNKKMVQYNKLLKLHTMYCKERGKVENIVNGIPLNKKFIVPLNLAKRLGLDV